MTDAHQTTYPIFGQLGWHDGPLSACNWCERWAGEDIGPEEASLRTGVPLYDDRRKRSILRRLF